MFIELHMIQNFSPSNLNRDDLNNPKECQFGGVRRARISSQCIKQAIRNTPVFAETTKVEPGTRTRWTSRLLCKALTSPHRPEPEAQAVAVRFAEAFVQKMDSDEKARTSIQVYISPEELQEVAETMERNWDIVKQPSGESDKLIADTVKQLLAKFEVTSAPDIALFGRMLAIKPTTKILEASCQIAHAISTHEVTMEMDFFTAVDHVAQGEETGAGMMGYTGYNSACFYRYSRLDWEQLVKNLGEDKERAKCTVEGFLRASVAALPTGKQNSTAANNPPSFLLAVVWEKGMGWSLSNAFEKPVRRSHEGGLVAPSVAALDKYWGRLCQVYGRQGQVQVVVLPLDDSLSLSNFDKDQVKATVDAWVEAVMKSLPAQ